MMHVNKLLSSFFSALIAVFFILLGTICTMLPYFSTIRTYVISFLLQNSISLALMGIIMVMIGLFIILTILLSARRRDYRIRSGRHTTIVNKSLIQQYLDSYWKELFPEQDIPNNFILKTNGIHITADFPFLPVTQQKPFLEKIKKELTHILTTIIGYDKELFLAASFPETTSH